MLRSFKTTPTIDIAPRGRVKAPERLLDSLTPLFYTEFPRLMNLREQFERLLSETTDRARGLWKNVLLESNILR